MKKVLLFSFITLLSLNSFSQKNQNINLDWVKVSEVKSPNLSKAVTDWIFYCGDPNNGIGTGGAVSFGSFIHIPTDLLTAHDGRQIQELQIQIPEPENISSVEIQIYEESGSGTPGTPVYTQSFTPNQDGAEWTSILLSTPYNIDPSQEIIVGYYMEATGGHPAGCDDGPANSDGNLMIWEGDWTHLSGFGLAYNWNIKAGIGDKPANDIMMSSINLADFIAIGNTDIIGTVKNLGTNQINSFDLNWQVDGGIINTENVSGLSLNTDDTYDYTHGTQWISTIIGEYNLNVWASNMNEIGVDDDSPNNDTLQKSITVIYPVDATLSSINTTDYAYPGNLDVGGTVLNSGVDNITSFDISYNVDGGTESSVFSISGQNIALGETFDFTHDIVYSFDTDGEYTINVTVSNINGGGETFIDDNILSKSIIINTNMIQRTVLLEQFTTEKCVFCPGVLTSIEEHMAVDPDFIMMAFHSGYYTDFLTTSESEAHLEFYNGDGPFAPAGMVDRHYNGLDNDGDGSAELGPVFWDGAPFGPDRISERTSVPALLSVNLEETYNSDTQEIPVNVSGEFFADFFHPIGVSLWILEDNIPEENQENAINWIHRYVVRDAVSDRLGDEITSSTNVGDSYSMTYTYTPDASWNAGELYLTALVSNLNADDVKDREVCNAKQIKIIDMPNSINEISNKIKVYPVPARNTVNIQNAENTIIEITDISGKIFLTQTLWKNDETINVRNLSSGIYIIKFTTEKESFEKKISIVK